MSITIPTQPSDKLRCPNCGGSMKIANKRIAELQAQVDSLQELLDMAHGRESPDAPRGIDQLAVPPDER